MTTHDPAEERNVCGHDRITVTVEAEDDLTGRVLEGWFEVGAPEELELALGEAAEELLEAGLDASHGVWLTVRAEGVVRGRNFERQRDPYAIHERGALRTDMHLMGRELAIALRKREQTTRARVEIEGMGEAQAEAADCREMLLSLRAKALRVWEKTSAMPASAHVRIVVETERDGVYEADFSAADRDEFWSALTYHVQRLSMEAGSAGCQRERDEERARLEADRAATRVRLLAEARAHPDWGAFLDWAAENERFVDSCENALGRGRAWNANLVAAHQSGAVGGGRDLDPAHLRLLELLLRIECEDASAWR